jgi:hypothetical protein
VQEVRYIFDQRAIVEGIQEERRSDPTQELGVVDELLPVGGVDWTLD